VFCSVTKATGYDRVGIVMVSEAAKRARARGLPLVAIGGITLVTAASVIEAGATSVAIIGDLLASGNPEARVREYLERLSMANG
jgi:thiamine-phosphate pyrophosphorylase